MINVDLGERGKYCLIVRASQGTIGKEQHRRTVEVEIYNADRHPMIFVTKGLSVCHPSDPFDAHRGAKLALKSALEPYQGWFFSEPNRREFFDVLNSWF